MLVATSRATTRALAQAVCISTYALTNNENSCVGSPAIPKGCGFTLQNRGSNFVLDTSHSNALQVSTNPALVAAKLI